MLRRYSTKQENSCISGVILPSKPVFWRILHIILHYLGFFIRVCIYLEKSFMIISNHCERTKDTVGVIWPRKHSVFEVYISTLKYNVVLEVRGMVC